MHGAQYNKNMANLHSLIRNDVCARLGIRLDLDIVDGYGNALYIVARLRAIDNANGIRDSRIQVEIWRQLGCRESASSFRDGIFECQSKLHIAHIAYTHFNIYKHTRLPYICRNLSFELSMFLS